MKVYRRFIQWWQIAPMRGAHYATFYGVPVWFADVPPDGCTMAGRNQLYAPFFDYGFPVWVGPRVDGSDAHLVI